MKFNGLNSLATNITLEAINEVGLFNEFSQFHFYLFFVTMIGLGILCPILN